MKLILTLIIGFCSLFVESNTELNSSTEKYYFEDERLEAIRENFLSINRIKDWTNIEEIHLHQSTEGGTALFYHFNSKLMKIEVVHFGEHGKKTQEFYTLNDRLSFILEKHFQYNRPIGYDSIERELNNDSQSFNFDSTTIIMDSSFFIDGNLIRQINNQDCGSPFSNDYIQLERKRLLHDFNELKSLLKD